MLALALAGLISCQGGPLLHKERAFASLGYAIGDAGLLVVDLGTHTEIISSCSLAYSLDNTYWVSLAAVVQPQRFDPVFASVTRPLAYAIARMIAVDVDGDGVPELILLDRRGGVEIHDLISREIEASWRLAGLSGIEILASDLNRDGTPELLILDGAELSCLTPNGQLLWSLPSTARAMTIGDLDGDAFPEIVLSDGRALDGRSQAVIWTQSAISDTVLAMGDVDGDGAPELVAAERMHIAAYDAAGAEKWRFLNTQGYNGELRLEDLDSDPGLEMVVSDLYGSSLEAWDGATQALDARFDLLRKDVEAYAFGDPDEDGQKDLVWSTHRSHSSEQYLRTRDLASGVIEFTSKMLIGPFHGPVIGDVDGDGTNEVLLLSTESGGAIIGTNSGVLISLNAETMELEAISDPFDDPDPNFTTGQMTALALHDMDGDGRMEILMGSEAAGWGFVMVARQSLWGTFSLLLTSAELTEGLVTAITAGELTGDLQPEIVVGTYGRSNRPATVQILDGSTGQVLWKSANLGPSQARVESLLLANVDADAALEICAIADPGDIYVWDGTTHLLQANRSGSYTSLELVSVGGLSLLAAGNAQGRVELLDASAGSLTLRSAFQLPEGPVRGLEFLEMPAPVILAGARGIFALQAGAQGPRLLTDQFMQPIGRNMFLAPDRRHLYASVPYGLQIFSR